jgi:nucleolar complex protein 2
MEKIDEMMQKVTDTKSTRHMKQLVVAYKSGCHFREGEEAEEGEKMPFRVSSSEVFNHLMVTGIAEFPLLFHALFGVEEKHQVEETQYQKDSQASKKKKEAKVVRLQTRICKSERWSKLESCVRSYLKSTIFLLDQMTDQKIITFILRRISQNVLVYFACVPYIANKLLRVLSRFWSSAEETNRVLAFVAIRELTILTPYPFIDSALKGLYLTFVKNSKFTNRATLPTIQFMSNCVVEMFGLDFKSSYQHAFSHIRVLAVKLRNAIIGKTQEHFSMIHSWQFYHSLNLWAEVLCTYAEQLDM